MKIIDKILQIIILILMFIAQQLPAQVDLQKLEEATEHSEEIRFLSTSRNGSWKVWQSSYETKPPQLKIADSHHPETLFTQEGVGAWKQVGDKGLLMKQGEDLKYRILGTNKETVHHHVKEFGYQESQNFFWILHNKKLSKALKIYNHDSKLINIISDVERIFALKNELILLIKKNENNELYCYNGRNLKLIWSGTAELYRIYESGLVTKGYTLILQETKGLTTYYVNENAHLTALSLDEGEYFDDVSQYPSADVKAVYLRLSHKKEKEIEKSMVDIWYGKDFDLEQHFHEKPFHRYVLWYPLENRIVSADRKRFGKMTAVGKSGLFLTKEIDSTLVDPHDKKGKDYPERFFIYNPEINSHLFVDEISQGIHISPSGKWLLYRKDSRWNVYNTLTNQRKEIDLPEYSTPYYCSSDKVLWVRGNEIWLQNLRNFAKSKQGTFTGTIEILNAEKQTSELGYSIIYPTVGLKHELLLKIKEDYSVRSSVVSWKNGRSLYLILNTDDRITEVSYNQISKSYTWIRENYNKAPEIIIKKPNEQARTLYASQQPASTKMITMKRLHYKGPNNEDLSAILYFPPNFKEDKKYPVVLSIYEMQSQNANKYLPPTFKNSRGFNERFFLESGYIILLPDISPGDKEPGYSALHCVNNALDQLATIQQADMKRVGLVGQSFGGYQTNFIATQSDRFAAYISGASISDVINTSFAFNYNHFSADYWRYEDGQFRFGDFVTHKQRYIDNNPLYYAHQVNAPMLLWTGTADKNVNPEQTRTMYNVLRKHKKTVIALFYQDELHALTRNSSRKDLSIKMLEWFGYFLKDHQDVPWINKQIKKHSDRVAFRTSEKFSY
ncbi:Dipeptidyl aminopeptidase/acylaminoacyl peptidase [Chryseobacterium rhizoplanae]|uniref:Dipeptidyl aminopeptidase/acylaminoacyl peptidase n=1 Tax=Chryseobacterium rhizoplanae TaxID=1609531 RepID=A0A521DL35_9FLAO|nr:prolyl oligopeptidase family serine peptidase [Chryseobacterium rhizoplanae]SMO72292.1 Dipeptidyl aminopeptidase/acylaminoacyl peptidase [Chryseobacterium rhizoplanae]